MNGEEAAGPQEERSCGEAADLLLAAPGAILEALPDAVVACSPNGRIVFVNALAEELFGHTRQQLLGAPVQTLWPERLRERYTRNMELYFATEHPMRFTTEAWGLRRDGSEFVGEMSWGVVRAQTGTLLLAVGRDVSERRAAEARLRELTAVGERALAGATPAELAADAVRLIRTTLPVDAAQVRLADGAVLAADGAVPDQAPALPIGAVGELRVALRRPLTEDETTVVRAVANLLGTAMERLRDEERIHYDAVHDPLTGLANRTLLRDRLEHALAQSQRDGSDTGVLFVDLDNFKQVNDEHGHPAGDALLAELGRRLLGAVRPADMVARLGGDEFVVLCERTDRAGVLALARRLQAAIERPVEVDGVHHAVSASIGIALGHLDADVLLREADAAVYRAKAGGGGCVELAPFG